jgi:uncharacterized protein with HEPN domain
MKMERDYLVDLLDRIKRIQEFTQAGRTAFMQSELIQDAVIRNFEVIGEITKRLPDDLLEQQPQAEWKQIKGFRDILAHNYDNIVLKVVWDSVEKLATLRAAVEALLAGLDEEQG